MAVNFTISTFNCENLFERAELLNLSNWQTGTAKLNELAQLQAELAKATYDQATIFKLYKNLSML